MRVALGFVALTLLLAGTSGELIPQLDREDNIVGFVEANLAADFEPPSGNIENAQGTPEAISKAIKKEFANAPTKNVSIAAFDRSFREFYWWCGCVLNLRYKVEDRCPTKTQNPCDLEPGNYTWTITTDAQFTFVQVKDVTEWGSRHIQESNGRTAYVAGELHMPDRKDAPLTWNLGSGSVTNPLIAQVGPNYMKTLEKRMRVVFTAAHSLCPSRRFQFTKARLFTQPPPTREFVNWMCTLHTHRLWLSRCEDTPDGPFKRYLCDEPEEVLQCYITPHAVPAKWDEPPAYEPFWSRYFWSLTVLAAVAAACVAYYFVKPKSQPSGEETPLIGPRV